MSLNEEEEAETWEDRVMAGVEIGVTPHHGRGTGHPQEPGERPERTPAGFRGSRPCWHLDRRLLATRLGVSSCLSFQAAQCGAELRWPPHTGPDVQGGCSGVTPTGFLEEQVCVGGVHTRVCTRVSAVLWEGSGSPRDV